MTPNVTNQKTDGNLSVAQEGARILAVIAPAEKGDKEAPTLFTSTSQAIELHGQGELTEAICFLIDTSNTAVLGIRGEASVPGVASALIGDHVTGTSVITLSGAPFDAYHVLVQYLSGGTIGAAGITLRYSLDNGKTWSSTQRLGVATSFLIPGSGVTVAMAAGTIVTGDYIEFTTTAPRMNGTDLLDALTALREYDGEWLRALIGGIDADSTILSQLNVQANAFHGDNHWPEFIANMRPRTLSPAEETRTAYRDYVAAQVEQVQSLEVMACVDQCEIVSSVTGRRIRRPQALAVAARSIAMPNDAIDLAEVAQGALKGVFLTSADGLVKYHDERKFKGLDELFTTTLRSFGVKSKRKGAYVNNARVLSGGGSDYRFFQHTAVHNRAIEMVAAFLEGKLSMGVLLNANGTIRDDIAKGLEDACDTMLRSNFMGDSPQVSGLRLQLSRTDDILATDTISYWVPIQPLGYVKEFKGKSGLVRTFAAAS